MGKTITTYLIKGDPMGARYVFLDDSTCKMFIVPRAELTEILNKYKDELGQPALYILLGEDTEGKPKAYIGSTDNFAHRILSHDNKKDFWSKALAFISATHTIDKADSLYLEYLAFALASKVGRFVLDDNKQIPKEPSLPEWKRDTADKIFDTVQILTAFVGCNVFTETNIHKKEAHLFYCNRKCKATGVYSSQGLTVLKGSELCPNNSKHFRDCDVVKRQKFISNFCKLVNGIPITTCDCDFSSPSTAAMMCIGSSANGWTEWKDLDGKTLDEIYRK